MRLFHSATIFCCNICTCIFYLKLHQVGEVFFNSIWWGPLSSNVLTIYAVYWSLGRRGYFGVSNVGLVCLWFEIQGSRTDNFVYWVLNTDEEATIVWIHLCSISGVCTLVVIVETIMLVPCHVQSIHCNSFEDRVPVDFNYGCPILEWVAVTSFKDRPPL